MSTKNIKFRIEAFMEIESGLTPDQEVLAIFENLGSDFTHWINKDHLQILEKYICNYNKTEMTYFCRFKGRKDMVLNSFEEKIQEIMDGLGAVKGVTYALLVVDTGVPLIVAQTTLMEEGIVKEIAELVAKVVSTTSKLSHKFDLQEKVDFIQFQTPLGLGLFSQVDDKILVLITRPDVKMGLIYHLITSTKTKIRKVSRLAD